MFKQYLSYSGLRRIFLGVFIAIFLGVNAGSFILYAYFSSTLLKEINASTLNMLTKVRNGTELIYNEITSLMLQLVNGDITITRIMFESDRDRLVEYQGHQTMQKAVVSYPYIEYLAIYNERFNEIMATKDLSEDTRKELINLTNNYFRRYPRNMTIPLKISLYAPKPLIPKTANTITLIIYSPLSLEDDKGALILGINCTYFQQLLRQMDEGDLETIMILHGDNRVISHPDGTLQLLDFSDKDYVRQIKASEGESGFFIRKINGTPTYVSFTKSSTLGWTFISMIPYKKLVAKLSTLRFIVLGITFTILCIGVFVSYRMAVTMYSPIQKILKRLDFTPSPPPLTWFNKKAEDTFIDEKIDYLRSAADKSKALMRSMAILELLKNQYAESDTMDAKVLDEAFGDPYHLVCLVSINDEEQFEKLKPDEQGIIRHKLAAIGAELFKKCCKSLDYAALEPGSIAFVLGLESGVYPDELYPLLLEIGVAMQKYCEYTTSAAAGSMVNSIFAINDSYEEAEKLIQAEKYKQAAARGPYFIKESLILIEKRYTEPFFSVNTAAEFYNITPAYFNRIFKKAKGLSFSEYLNNYRMEMACQLLLKTSQAVGAISSSVGIANTNYFYTLFKKNYNLTPQQFRINHGIRGLS